MQNRLIDATIECLDRCGYAGTSISVVQQAAKVSRGAILHHYPSRQDLIAATAQRLLEAAILPTRESGEGQRFAPRSIADFVAFHWRRVVNTREGRAFIEILVACRTDKTLEAALADTFSRWDKEIAENALARFNSKAPEPDDAAILWAIGRAFLRGLIIHARFVEDRAHLERMVSRFGDLISSQLTLRSEAH
jgi:AcrR family transcriptional regulator